VFILPLDILEIIICIMLIDLNLNKISEQLDNMNTIPDQLGSTNNFRLMMGWWAHIRAWQNE